MNGTMKREIVFRTYVMIRILYSCRQSMIVFRKSFIKESCLFAFAIICNYFSFFILVKKKLVLKVQFILFFILFQVDR
jgi:hypothetical protein